MADINVELCLMCGGTGNADWGDHVEVCSDCDGGGWLPIAETVAKTKVYVASKSKFGSMWKSVREPLTEGGVQIVSTWIDECGEGETVDFADLWMRCVTEASTCDLLVAYHEDGDVWKGAFIEIGSALSHGVPVYVLGRPPGSWVDHPLVTFAESIDDAIEDFRSRPRAN